MVVLSERSEPKDLLQMPNKPHIAPKLFCFTHFTKNASATPLVSYTLKTKDLKPFRFTHFQKRGGLCFPPYAHLQARVTDHGFDLALATWRRFPYTLGFLATVRRIVYCALTKRFHA